MAITPSSSSPPVNPKLVPPPRAPIKTPTASNMTTNGPSKRKFCEVSTVTLYVGPKKLPFIVHQNILCEHSRFFEAAFTGNSKEGSDQKMDLPEEHTSTMELFIQWLYSQRHQLTEEEKNSASGSYLWHSSRLYVLGDNFDVPRLKCDILREMFAFLDKSTTLPSSVLYSFVHDNTAKDCGMRRYLLYLYVHRMGSEWWKKPEQEEWLVGQPEMAVGLALAFARERLGANTEPWTKTVQDFLDK